MYHLIKECNENRICLGCARISKILSIFGNCICKTPRHRNLATGNKSLGSFIMKPWKGTDDAYIQWIEYSLLRNVREMTSLCHGCTHIADLLNPVINKWMQVALKQISDTQLLDFHQVNYFTC